MTENLKAEKRRGKDSGKTAGEPLPEEERLKNLEKCHQCGSIVFIWAGTCRLCSVCGESQGCG